MCRDVFTMDLSGQEIDVLEDALLNRRKKLRKMRRNLNESSPAEAALIEVVEQDLKMGDDLLRRLQALVQAVAQPLMKMREQPG